MNAADVVYEISKELFSLYPKKSLFVKSTKETGGQRHRYRFQVFERRLRGKPKLLAGRRVLARAVETLPGRLAFYITWAGLKRKLKRVL